MKHFFTFSSIISALSLIMLFQSCDAGVNLNDVDTSVKVKANLATPIGSVSATIGDFVGDGTWGIYIDTVKNHGVLTFKDTFTIQRNFHNLDLSRYISRTQLKMNIYNQVGGNIQGNGKQIELKYPLTLKLKGINQDIDNQRIDSALIKNASFTSKITSVGNSPIKWEWIDKVTLTLGKNFNRPAGNTIVIYKKGDNYSYGKDIPVNIDEFSLNLMKNKNPQSWKDYINNVTDSCTFDITVFVTVPTSAGTVSIPSTAAFQYDLGVQFIAHHAVWGMFEPSKDMSAEAEDRIADFWSPWNTIQKLNLPLAEPSIDVTIVTEVAGAFILEGDYLYTKNEQGEKRYATFKGSQQLYKYFDRNEYLPLSSAIGSKTNTHILFDNDPERGHMDNLLTIRPDKVGYKFAFKPNEQETPQMRLTKNSNIRIDAACNLPMIFNQGVELAYADTIKGIDLSMLDLDSLLNEVDEVDIIDTLEEASAKLVIKIENTIPLQFKAVLTCLDENNNVIIDPKTNQPFLITENDTITIGAPKFEFVNHTWQGDAMESIEIVNVDREDLETIRRINKIAYYVSLDDESLAYAYEQGLFNVKLSEDNSLRIKLAVAANAEGILKYEF